MTYRGKDPRQLDRQLTNIGEQIEDRKLDN